MYNTDVDKKYLYIADNICHGGGSVCDGCKFDQRIRTLPLMAGIVCGAYSSVCITGALWYVMKTGKNAKVQAASVPAKQVESVKTESSEESSSDGNVQKAAKSKTKKKKKRR